MAHTILEKAEASNKESKVKGEEGEKKRGADNLLPLDLNFSPL
jgi:U3 small nucleolar ribonucleoprotein component